jgi:hypothetical protein
MAVEEVASEGGWELAKRALPYVLTTLQLGGTLGARHFGGKQARRQEEENKRSEARAAMISALTGQRAIAQPQIMQSPAANAFSTMANIGSLGMNLLPYMPRRVTNPEVTSATRGLAQGQTQNNPIPMPNTDVVADRYISPPLIARPDRVMGISNPIPQYLSGIGYSDPNSPYG